ncbi:hypothetical protein M0R45_008026 [Rubus argutus]|uniref:Uncharacterized protein n=1 Tax=Rubus argutus TaxID=59490 RepID=A0AAW1Y1L2_RUBAR
MGGNKRELIHKSWKSLLKEICRRHDDWMSYKEACEDDPELKSFDANLQNRTTNPRHWLYVGCLPAATAIGATIAPTIAGHVWALSLIEQYEKRLENEKDILHTMHNASVFAIKELADVKFLIDKVVKEIDTFLFRPAPNSAIEGQVETVFKNIKTQLDVFLKKIEDLENKETNCSSEILSARDKVVRSMNEGALSPNHLERKRKIEKRR